MIMIGGIGGSGTRLICEMFEALGYSCGDDLNETYDYLLFTTLFINPPVLLLPEKEISTRIRLFIKVIKKQEKISTDDLSLLEKYMLKNSKLYSRRWIKQRMQIVTSCSKNKAYSSNICWKEPNSHFYAEEFLNKIGELKFIYVYRHGLDMAYSTNQNQFRLWGSLFLDRNSLHVTPKNSLKFWCVIHRRMVQLHEKYPERILLLNFEKLCEFPLFELDKLSSFLEKNIGIEEKEKLAGVIKIPNTIGRHKLHDFSTLDEQDVSYAKKMMA